MPQTSVQNAMTIGIVGQLADFQSAGDAIVDSGFSEEESAGIPPGFFVIQGDADDGCLLPTSQGDVLKGLVVQTHDAARNVELDADGNYKPTASFGLLEVGTMTVAPATAAAPGDNVHVQMVAEGGFPAGCVRNSPSSGKTLDITAFSQWKTTAANSGDPCVLRVDLTNVALAAVDA